MWIIGGFFAFVFWIVCISAGADIAASKNRTDWWIAAVFGFLGVVILYMVPKKDNEEAILSFGNDEDDEEYDHKRRTNQDAVRKYQEEKVEPIPPEEKKEDGRVTWTIDR